MGSQYGYTFMFDDDGDVLTFPITPGELTYKVGSKNETVTLINEGEINIPKPASLFEIEFEARFPMVKYPFSREAEYFDVYFKKFHELKEKQKNFKFLVSRHTFGNRKSWGSEYPVLLEDFEINENADEGDDVLITFKLKQYKPYGVRKVKVETTAPPSTTSTSDEPRDTGNKASEPETYTIKSGDTLWAIAKAKLGNGSLYTKIFDANAKLLDSEAQKHGKSSSSNGHWIYPGTTITIPAK